MSDIDLPDVTESKPEPAGSDGLEARGQGAGRLLGQGGELAISGDDAEHAAQGDPDAVAPVERHAEEHPDTD
jgi:hypothetical protein